jgi:hypothetical protein
MKRLKRFCFCLSVISLLVFLAGSSPAYAQTGSDNISLDNVHLWLNPEYDDPRLLVMLEGQIADFQSPITMRFLVPAEAEMYSAGSMDAQGSYSGGPPDRIASSIPGWDEISYVVQTQVFRLEYYDPIIMGQPDKSISYEFLRLYPISSLQIIIQEPRTASDFAVSPAGQPYVDSEGFNTNIYSYSNLEENTPIDFQITYTKSDTRPSLSITDTGSSSPQSSSSITGTGNSGPLVAAIVILALALAIAIVFFWRRKSGVQNRAARKQTANQNRNRFCPQCGKPVAGSDKFCAHCGTNLSLRG